MEEETYCEIQLPSSDERSVSIMMNLHLMGHDNKLYQHEQ